MLLRLRQASGISVYRGRHAPLYTPNTIVAGRLHVGHATSGRGNRDHDGEGQPSAIPSDSPQTSASTMQSAQEWHQRRDFNPSKPDLKQSSANAADAYAGTDDGREGSDEAARETSNSSNHEDEATVAPQGGPVTGNPAIDDEICVGEQDTAGDAGLAGPDGDDTTLRMRLPHVLAMSVVSFASARVGVIARSGPRGGAHDIDKYREISLHPPTTNAQQCGSPPRETPIDQSAGFITSDEYVKKAHQDAYSGSSSSTGAPSSPDSSVASQHVPGNTSTGGYEDELNTGKVTIDKSAHVKLAEEAQMRMHTQQFGSDPVSHKQHAPDGSAYTRIYNSQRGYMGTAQAVEASEAGARAGMQVEPPSMAEHHHQHEHEQQYGDQTRDQKDEHA